MGTVASVNRTISSMTKELRNSNQNIHEQIEEPSANAEKRIASIVANLEARFPSPTLFLTNASFRNGTYRILKSGYYKLAEDIVFDPPELKKPNNLYSFPPYQLGFFAAITIESEGVILDLGGYTVSQSPRHALVQRFHAVIELSSQPFNARQGPSGFGDTNRSANKCLIKNGYLGRSSHHGIHSSGTPTDIVIQDLNIFDFEIAGVHLNGVKNAHLQRLHIGPNFQQVPVMATFSQAVFALTILRNMTADQTWRTKMPQKIAADLEGAIEKVKQEVLAGAPVSDPLFRNDSGLVDGNIYGIVVHGTGVVVGDFKEDTTEGAAEAVTITEVCIEGLKSKPNTVKSMTLTAQEDGENYGSGGRVHTGPIGDVVDFERIVGNGSNIYVPNPLSEAQFLSAKWSKGTARSSDAVLRWAEENIGSFSHILSRYPYDCSRDAMDHVMKGNFGCFASNVNNLDIVNLVLCDLENTGAHAVEKETCTFRGNALSGIVIDAVQNVNIINTTVTNLKSTNGLVCGVEVLGTSRVHTENVEITRLSPAGNRCAMMKTGAHASVAFGSGHQPAQIKK